MAYRQVNYQYETSPRKVKPEYEQKRNPYAKKKKASTLKKKEQPINEQNKKEKNKNEKNLKSHIKTALYILVGFAILFAISYRNSLITASFDRKENLKSKLSTLQKENAQLEISIQSSLNLANIEKSASELLGMKKLDESQKVYVTLPKRDYVQPASEQVLVTEETSWYEKLINSIMEIFK